MLKELFECLLKAKRSRRLAGSATPSDCEIGYERYLSQQIREESRDTHEFQFALCGADDERRDSGELGDALAEWGEGSRRFALSARDGLHEHRLRRQLVLSTDGQPYGTISSNFALIASGLTGCVHHVPRCRNGLQDGPLGTRRTDLASAEQAIPLCFGSFPRRKG